MASGCELWLCHVLGVSPQSRPALSKLALTNIDQAQTLSTEHMSSHSMFTPACEVDIIVTSLLQLRERGSERLSDLAKVAQTIGQDSDPGL